jgi:CBS domain-containing protein
MVQHVMRRNFAQADPEESVASARETMRLGRMRHLLVTRGDALLGILSYRDLLERLQREGAENESAEPLRVSELMRKTPVCIAPEASLAEAADRLCRYHIGCVPVVNAQDKLVGLVTETDLLRAAFGLPAL